MIRMPQDERRGARRYFVQLPIVITTTSESSSILGVTRDVSTAGVFFYAKDWLTELSIVQLAMVLPPVITGREVVRVVCNALVMRVEDGRVKPGKLGIAVKIEHYEFN